MSRLEAREILESAELDLGMAGDSLSFRADILPKFKDFHKALARDTGGVGDAVDAGAEGFSDSSEPEDWWLNFLARLAFFDGDSKPSV